MTTKKAGQNITTCLKAMENYQGTENLWGQHAREEEGPEV